MSVNPDQFRRGIQSDAEQYLIDMLGSEQGKAASVRVAMAFSSAVRTAKSPASYYLIAATDEGRASIVSCIAMSALTGLMPGGPNPTVYLIPKGGQLHWWLTHRGVATLALRAGYQIIAVPVHKDDDVRVEFGEVVAHEPDPDRWAESLDDLRGVYVTTRRLSDGAVLGRPWMPVAAIRKRSTKAQTQDVWKAWGTEQAQKTAIKWAMARGYIPVESPELGVAMESDAESQVVDVEHREVPTDRPTGRSALGLGGDRPALVDHGEPVDLQAEAARVNAARGEVIDAKPEPAKPRGKAARMPAHPDDVGPAAQRREEPPADDFDAPL